MSSLKAFWHFFIIRWISICLLFFFWFFDGECLCMIGMLLSFFFVPYWFFEWLLCIVIKNCLWNSKYYVFAYCFLCWRTRHFFIVRRTLNGLNNGFFSGENCQLWRNSWLSEIFRKKLINSRIFRVKTHSQKFSEKEPNPLIDLHFFPGIRFRSLTS